MSIPTPEDDTAWFDFDEYQDPRDAHGLYFKDGAFDAQHGSRVPKAVDPLYQADYNEGFAFGLYLDLQLHRDSM